MSVSAPVDQTVPAAAEELAGEVESIVWRSPDTGFGIMRVLVKGMRDPVTIVGTSAASLGEIVSARGKWKKHPTYGLQFDASLISTSRPTSVRAIERYLASGVLKGIGPALASRIVERFGEKTFEIFETSPLRVAEINGISRQRAEQIGATWKSSEAERNVMVFLAGHGIQGALANRIVSRYAGKTVEIVERQPYRLAKEVRGIGFATADGIALKLGIPRTSPARIEAGLIHLISSSSGMGSCGMRREKYLGESAKLLDLDLDLVEPVMDGMLQEREYVVGVMLSPGQQFVFDKRLYDAEKRIATTLQGMTTAPPWSITMEEAEAIAREAAEECGVSLAPQQHDAVVMALTARASVLTGGPGTGKTSTLQVVLCALQKVRAQVKLGAPTGKAAKRMRESTGHSAATVARLIGMGREGGGDDVTIECEILIIDEASMIDVNMLDRVLLCLVSGAAIMFVGDVDQLPSVGPGRVLADLIDSGSVPTVRLTQIFRQAAESAIVRNAHRINHGKAIEPRGNAPSDFYFIECDNTDEIPERIAKLVEQHIPTRVGIGSRDVQVLSPMRRTTTGTEALNDLLQSRLNPEPTAMIEKFGKRYGVGDRVLQTVNNYDLGVMNGESGIIDSIDKEADRVRVLIDESIIEYPFADVDQLDLAYAMTIHKSQGSQFPAIVIPVSKQHYNMLLRPIIYTGITRATKFCVLIGQRSALDIAIKNARMEPRVTSLLNRLERAA